MYDMNDVELITWIEKRFGLTKSVGNNPTNDQIGSVETELVSILNKYKNELNISSPLPRVKMWITNDKVNFMFFDKKSGKRILLGDWLSNKGDYYEQ